jgi:hypothetical protein
MDLFDTGSAIMRHVVVDEIVNVGITELIKHWELMKVIQP